MQINRLSAGGRIDRSQAISFKFNGKSYQGYRGDTLASALLANDVSIIGRSFKYHRPRGIVACSVEEPNAILQIGNGATTLPNQRATQVELYQDLDARSIQGWPSINFDVMEMNDVFSRVLGAGFYYKTFMQPQGLWDFYERFIRRAAGLGHSPREPDPDKYEHFNAHCDVLVVGAGPAGLMAALAAAKSGARVIIVDEQNEFGGSLLHSTAKINNMPAIEWLDKVLIELSACAEVTMLPRSTAFGYFDYNFITVSERCTEHLGEHQHDKVHQRLWRVRAKRVILAQGAIERPLVFSNNDRPGVMLASAVSIYINRYAVTPGKRAIVFTNNDSAYQTALDMKNAGINVIAIIDSRQKGAGEIHELVKSANIPVEKGAVITNVIGKKRLRKIHISRISVDGKTLTEALPAIACDLIAMSGGWSPVVHLHSQAGGKNNWDEDLCCFVPLQSPQFNVPVGAANGMFELAGCLEQGIQAGFNAVEQCGFNVVRFSVPEVEVTKINSLQALWRVPSEDKPERQAKQFLDYQNDTTVSDVRLAVREGFQNIEHIKRYTALGFGTDQGKLGNINGMAVLAETLNVPVGSVGTTTFRPAYTPVCFGVCAGENVNELFEPVRKTALHDWHKEKGAIFEVVGQWLRPWYFPKKDEDLTSAVNRECLAARNSLAIMDASTLGKIEVTGADALTFLERIYTHNVAKIQIGHCAYGIMLGEDGMVMDDGVITRLGEQHFYLTTTTGGAANVLNWMEKWLQTEWPGLNVYLTSVTDRWSTIALVGPNSRKLLQGLESEIDFVQEEFPFMSVKSGALAGMQVQVFRISFSGELAFEINIESDLALAMWQKLIEVGEQYDITPYGTETMHVLRAEKGYFIVGQDTDGSVTPGDLGMNWLLAKDKNYLGKRSLNRPDCLRTDRKQFVGLVTEDGKTVLPEGAQLVDSISNSSPIPMLGHVTSSYYSACLKQPIALALLKEGRKRKNETLFAVTKEGTFIKVRAVSPVFYDVKGERQHV